ncbi:hypothetical protein BFP70_03960 [Thioclava sp. SK-1]|nr:hypothetical protein BFP70_03960 [Thioclava sp. SK-1]
MAACVASKIAQQAAITGSLISMVVLRTTPQRRPAMAKVEHTADARVLVGIDISKHRHEVLIAVPGKMRRRRLTITNSTDDFMQLIAILLEYSLPLRIGFEATGNYHRVLMYHLNRPEFVGDHQLK